VLREGRLYRRLTPDFATWIFATWGLPSWTFSCHYTAEPVRTGE